MSLFRPRGPGCLPRQTTFRLVSRPTARPDGGYQPRLAGDFLCCTTDFGAVDQVRAGRRPRSPGERPLTFRAAIGLPVASKIGAATELRPGSKNPSLQARPAARSLSRRWRNCSAASRAYAVYGRHLLTAIHSLDLFGRQVGEDDAAEVGCMGRKAAAHADVADESDIRGPAEDEHHLQPVEQGEMGRQAERSARPVGDRNGDLHDDPARKRSARRGRSGRRPMCQPRDAVSRLDQALGLQGAQQAEQRGAVDVEFAGGAGHVGDGGRPSAMWRSRRAARWTGGER